ncbi:MAG: cation-binding protein [Nitrososphaeraceae archaeon]|nr:cation-binding protein [Nitrososphaeraceae archaeon]
MSSTQSLRNDHLLIEKMLKSLSITIQLLQDGKKIPRNILEQTIDFTKNFTNICHHGKEEDSLFPNLEKNGMKREGGPIARMIFEHQITNQLVEKMEKSCQEYLESDINQSLLLDIQNYIDHVSSHLMKENLRLFVMADMILGNQKEEINSELKKTEESKLKEIGKRREHYEDIVENINLGLKNVKL